jgi:hypothetical protein
VALHDERLVKYLAAIAEIDRFVRYTSCGLNKSRQTEEKVGGGGGDRRICYYVS